ncbi:glutamate receptor 1-like [Schistocerca gregaria]|uniref:glutamate receptor 1-like n=1 Tax=Schistocerca gregaria TaxID=7010 RepID=UPI00211E8B81|nr:glutamate receptor 1-like [Schistocerca gregaria]
MASDILWNHFGDYKCIAALSDESDAVLDIVPSVTTTERISLASAEDPVEHLLISAMDADCQGLVVRCRDAVAGVDAILRASKLANRRGNRRLLVLPVAGFPPINVSAIFALRSIEIVPDIAVARQVDGVDSFELVTLKFTGEATWRDELVVARWRRGRGLEPPSADLFPDRMADMEGRQLVFATINYPPYVILKTESNTLDGVESRILLEFVSKKNATWRVDDYAVDRWGSIWDNGSGNGLLGAVAMGEADAAYAAVYRWFPEYLFVDYTRPYLRAGIACMAPRPRTRPGWQVPVLPFSPLLWAAVWASVILATLALYSARRTSNWVLGDAQGGGRYSTVEDCFFRSLGLLVLQTPDLERRHTRVVGPTRHVLSWLLIAYLLVTASYGSGLSSVLTVPRYERPIDTVSDLHESGLEWAERHLVYLYSIRELTDQIYVDLIQRFRVFSSDTLHSRTSTGDLAFVIERLPGGYFTIGDYIDEEAASRWLRPMREDIYWEYVVFAVPKGWAYLQRLDNMIDRLLQAGIMYTWEGQVARKWLVPRVQLAAQIGMRSYAQSPDGPIKLQLTHVQGEFGLLILGLFLSLVVLLVEIAIHRKNAVVAQLKGFTTTKVKQRAHPTEGPVEKGAPSMKHNAVPFDLMLREMTVDILTEYFYNFTCVASVSDSPDILLDLVTPLTTTVRVTVEGSDDAMLVSALDANCLGVVVRCRDAAGVVGALLKASRRATRRANRRLLVLPTSKIQPVDTDSLFALTDIKLAPDTLVARLLDDGVR